MTDIEAFAKLGALYIDPQNKLTFEMAAIAYMRSMHGGEHTCPKCGGLIYFSFQDVKGDEYTQSSVVYCKTCQIKSQIKTYDKYLPSPIQLSEILNEQYKEVCNAVQDQSMLQVRTQNRYL